MSQFFSQRGFLPAVFALLIIVVLAVYYSSLLPLGNIKGGDEYLTLDRTHSFVIRDDYLAVYTYNKPSFKKPPLQYWMSAYLIRQGADLEFAMRFPSFVFGMLTLISVGFLAYLLYPANPWVAPAAIALLAGSFTFWKVNISALLDAGAMFFATVGIIGCLLAFSRPKWWYLVALAIALAALQKAPIPLLLAFGMVVCAFATGKYHQLDLRASSWNRHFAIAAVLTVVALLIWPSIQWLRFGAESFQESHLDEMIGRFSVIGDKIGRHRWTTNFFDGEWFFRVPAILALLAIPFILRRAELLALPLLVIAFAIMIRFGSGYINPRYTLILLPVMMAALAAVIIKITPGRILPTAIIAALTFSLGGPIRSAKALGILSEDKVHPISALHNMSKMFTKDETLLVCYPGPKRSTFRLAPVSYFASNGRPLVTIDSPQAFEKLKLEGRIAPPYRGLCHADSFEKLKPLLPGHRIVEESIGYVHWEMQ